MAFQPLGFVSDPNIPRLTPTYPTGLPLHLMVASWFVGWQFTATVVNIFAALGSGLILWGLARRLQLTAEWAAAALALLWLCPLTLFATLQPMSDLLALFWSLTALWSALRCREHWRWTLLAGLSASLAVLVRPTNALLVLPLALALGADLRRHLLLILSGLPGAVFFCYYNWRAYGSPLTSGYGDVWNAFGPVNLAPNLSHFAWWIPALLTPLVVAALGAPLVRPARQRDLAVLGLWALLLIGFYACYYHSGETWWYLRFILPAFPVLILAALHRKAKGRIETPYRRGVGTGKPVRRLKGTAGRRALLVLAPHLPPSLPLTSSPTEGTCAGAAPLPYHPDHRRAATGPPARPPATSATTSSTP